MAAIQGSIVKAVNKGQNKQPFVLTLMLEKKSYVHKKR